VDLNTVAVELDFVNPVGTGPIEDAKAGSIKSGSGAYVMF